MIWLLLGMFLVLMVAPFVLSWYYTGKKKRTILDIPDETSDIPLSHVLTDNSELEHVERYNALSAPAKSLYENPLYIEGKASFGAHSRLNACHAKKELHLSKKCSSTSYLIAGEYLSIGEECALLGRTECGGSMALADGSFFYDLFARKIQFSGGALISDSNSKIIADLKASKKPDEIIRNIKCVDDFEIIEKNITTRHNLHIGKNAVIKGNILSSKGVVLDEGASVGGYIISRRTLVVGKNCKILGDISTERDIELEDNTTVLGNIISQKSIKIGHGCHVKGNVFAQASIEVCDDVTVGTTNQIKSIVAGDTISIRGKSTVFGRVRANRGGKLKTNEACKH